MLAGALPGLGLPASKELPRSRPVGSRLLWAFPREELGAGSLPPIPCLTQTNTPLSRVVSVRLFGGRGDEPFSISFHNSFLLLFCSFKCLLASDRSLSFYKRFCSPSRAACC